MLLPADAESFGQGIAPDGEPTYFFIRRSVLDAIAENGPAWKFHSIKLIAEILASPVAIFEGLGRDGCLAACCYCGLPPVCYRNDGTEAKPHPGYFFVIYVDPVSGGRYVVWDWGWRPEDSKKSGHPTGWESFEKGKVWPKQ
jgi:hypothetical protein